MPVYNYECRACDTNEDRVCGIDDGQVVCTECGEIMDRTISYEDAFARYFDNTQNVESN